VSFFQDLPTTLIILDATVPPMARRGKRPGKWQAEGQRAVEDIEALQRSWRVVRTAEHVEEDGLVRVLAPKFRGRLGKRMVDLAGKPQTYSLNLDEFGSAVWHLIDGERDVGAIADALAERFGEEVEPVLPRLLHFLRSLRNTHVVEVATAGGPE
jgi:hypothetical protein